jgi:hypothetical protein
MRRAARRDMVARRTSSSTRLCGTSTFTEAAGRRSLSGMAAAIRLSTVQPDSIVSGGRRSTVIGNDTSGDVDSFPKSGLVRRGRTVIEENTSSREWRKPAQHADQCRGAGGVTRDRGRKQVWQVGISSTRRIARFRGLTQWGTMAGRVRQRISPHEAPPSCRHRAAARRRQKCRPYMVEMHGQAAATRWQPASGADARCDICLALGSAGAAILPGDKISLRQVHSMGPVPIITDVCSAGLADADAVAAFGRARSAESSRGWARQGLLATADDGGTAGGTNHQPGWHAWTHPAWAECRVSHMPSRLLAAEPSRSCFSAAVGDDRCTVPDLTACV